MSSESLKSFIVTDPSLLDEGIDVSGLRTETDTDPRLLASIADFPGISYDPTSFDYLSDLNELFAYGLPGGDTSGAVTPPVTTTLDTGGGGQETSPSITDTIPELSSGAVNTAEEQRLIDAGIGVQGAPGDPVVAPSEIPYTQEQMDAENAIPVTPGLKPAIPSDSVSCPPLPVPIVSPPPPPPLVGDPTAGVVTVDTGAGAISKSPEKYLKRSE